MPAAYKLCLLKILSVAVVLIAEDQVSAQEVPKATAHRGPACFVNDSFFNDEVWAKVGERSCLKCHNAKGDASGSGFLLRDATNNKATRADAMRQNRAAFQRVAAESKDGKSLLLSKATGGIDHGGGEVIKTDSTGYRILKQFVRRAG